MPLALIRRLIKGTPLTALEHDGNLDVLETAIGTKETAGAAATAVAAHVAAADPHPTYLTASEGNAAYATAAQGALAASAVQPGAIGSSGLTMTAGILGRESGTGAPQVFTLGSGLSIVGGALVATGGPGGGYPSLSMPTGFSVSGSGTASLGVTFTAGYSLPTTAKQTEWDTAYSERLRWDGSSTGLNATIARASLGLGSAATAASSDFATAAQGSLAATAVQPAALGSYQPLDSDLTSIAALTTTTFGRSLLTQADAAAARTALGAGTVTGVTATGPITSSGGSVPVISISMATSRLLGRSSAGAGVAEEISLGANLTLSGGVLSASVTGGGGGSGTVTSVGLVAPTGFAVSGSPVTTSGNITLSFAAGYSLPPDSSQANWNTAFSERLRWDGSSTGLNAATARTSLGLGTLATQSGTFSGTSSGTNTGDNAVNTLYSGLVSNANHTGDATGSTVLTLATVNTNVGSFGSATAAPTFTVNAKGLITAASSTTITPALNSVTGLGTGVATALAANVGSVGAPVVLGGAGGTPSGLTLTNATGLPLATGVTGILPVANGGTGTTTPGLVAGANISISGTWPNQTISASAEGAVTAVTHGSNASTARPSGVTAVYWIGTVEPVNAVNGDLWIGGI
jgi:hypothetical protein